METNQNQPAFPIQPTFNNEGQICNERYAFEGLTKREYFAAKAMQGILAIGGFPDRLAKEANYSNSLCDMITKASIQMADELLKQLEERGEKI